MKQKNFLLRLAVLLAAMMCALGASAAEAYTNYTPEDRTLTFYYDNIRSSRSGKTYDLNKDDHWPVWFYDSTFIRVRQVVFDPSFAGARPTTTSCWFRGMRFIQSIEGMEYLNTSEVTYMDYMFMECTRLSSLDVSNFNTSKVTDMVGMFRECSGIASLDLRSFNTSKVTNMAGMFRYCYSLTSLNLSSFNTSQVTDMWNMFYDCVNLKTIYAGNDWSTAALTIPTDGMFGNCTSLVGGQGTTFDANHIDAAYARIDGGWSERGYFTEWKEPYACYTPENTTLTFYYDGLRRSRTATTYDLNYDSGYGSPMPDWQKDVPSVNVTKVVFDPSFAEARPTTTYGWFNGMRNLQSITGMEYLNTSEVTNMKWMFYDCYTLTSLDLSHFNTSKVIDMTQLFSYCSGLTCLDLTSFNTSQVTNMASMFSGCSNLRTIYVYNGWSTASVTESTYMFLECDSLVGGQGTTYSSSNPTDKTYARIDGGASNPGYLTAPTEPYAVYTSSNTTLTFYYDNLRSFRTGITFNMNTGYGNPGWVNTGSNASVTKVVFDPSFADARPTTTCYWFYKMRNLQSIEGLEYLNTSEVTIMTFMFENSNLTSLDVRHFDTSKVTEMGGMFYECNNLTSLDLRPFNTSNVTNMAAMFRECTSLTSLNLSSFNTSQVAKMGRMFKDANNLRTVYVGNGWSTKAAWDSPDMFENCTSLVGGQGTTFNESNPTDKTYAHIDGGTSNPGYFTEELPQAYAVYESNTLTFYYDYLRDYHSGTIYDLNTGDNMPGWGEDGTCASVTKVVFNSSFADARPTTTYDWFYNMTNFQSITGMEYLNTSEVTNMAWMFTNCAKLTSLDLRPFNTSKVTSMNSMFGACWGLTSLDLSSFNTSKVTDMFDMFFNDNNLKTIYVGNGWSTAAVSRSSGMFENCTSLVGGKGTTWNASNPIDKTYAHIDGGPSNPGYFTDKNAGLRGDVNGDGEVNISDVTVLINYLLSHNDAGVNLDAADCNQDSIINISDVTALINYLLSHSW